MSDSEEGDGWEVEAVINERWNARLKCRQYEVKWVDDDTTTWEPEENLDNCTELLAAYRRNRASEMVKEETPCSDLMPPPNAAKKRRAEPAADGADGASGDGDERVELSAASTVAPVADIVGATDRLPAGAADRLHATDAPPYFCVKYKDDKHAILSLAETRQQCPQKLIDFLIARLQWRSP